MDNHKLVIKFEQRPLGWYGAAYVDGRWFKEVEGSDVAEVAKIILEDFKETYNV